MCFTLSTYIYAALNFNSEKIFSLIVVNTVLKYLKMIEWGFKKTIF